MSRDINSRKGAAELVPGSLRGGVLLTIHRLSQGGADRVAMLLANGFVAAGIPTAILVFRTGGEAERTLLDLLDPRVAVVNAGAPMGSRHLELARGFFQLRREIACARPAVVMASSSNMGFVTGLAARRHRSRRPAFVMKLTNPVLRPRDNGPLKRHYRRALYRSVFNGFDRVLVLTESERKELARTYPDLTRRFEVVVNPYVPAAMPTRTTVPRVQGKRILAAARMMPQKRLDRLLSAMAMVADPEITLTILGDGPERSKLERQIDAYGLAERVRMPGFVTDILPWLQVADLVVLSSDYEGLPAVVLEALACNVPVVTTDCFAGARELLSGAERCQVVARDDVKGLARAIEQGVAGGKLHSLHQIAAPYRVDVAIAAHVQVLTTMILFCPTRPGGFEEGLIGELGASRGGSVPTQNAPIALPCEPQQLA